MKFWDKHLSFIIFLVCMVEFLLLVFLMIQCTEHHNQTNCIAQSKSFYCLEVE